MDYKFFASNYSVFLPFMAIFRNPKKSVELKIFMIFRMVNPMKLQDSSMKRNTSFMANCSPLNNNNKVKILQLSLNQLNTVYCLNVGQRKENDLWVWLKSQYSDKNLISHTFLKDIFFRNLPHCSIQLRIIWTAITLVNME